MALVADRVADAEDARVKEADDVAGVRRVDDLAVLREELLHRDYRLAPLELL